MARSRLHLQEHDDGSPVDPLDFRRALWVNQFDVYYRPVVDVSTGELAGAEALVRWRQNIWSAVVAHAVFDALQLTIAIPKALEFLQG